MRRLLLISLAAAAAGIWAPPALASAPEAGPPERRPCCLGLLEDPARPGEPRIGLFRFRDEGACDALLLDTGYPLSIVEKQADRKRLEGRPGPFSCRIAREGKTPRDWEKALVEMLSPGFLGEALLHQGEAQTAIEVFFRGLPDPHCTAWLEQAARNLPDPVAALLPDSLKSRHLPRAESALRVLGALVSAHPASAGEAVRETLGIRHRKLRPLVIRLAAEEAAGLRAIHQASLEADFLSERVREALEGRDARVRAAAAHALLLAEPDGGRRIALLAAAARDDRDPGTLAVLLSALREAGGIEELFALSHSRSPDLRREALRAAAALSEWPAGEADPLERLLGENRSDPGEAVRLLASRRGELPGRWAGILAAILPALDDADRSRIPAMFCRLDDSGALAEGLPIVLGMARDITHPQSASAAVSALADCGGSMGEEPFETVLEAARDPARGERALAEAAEAAARLAASPAQRERVLDFLRSHLDGGEEGARRAAVAGLVRLSVHDALRPVALLARAALRTPPDATARDAEKGLRRLYAIGPGPVTEALREAGRSLPEADRERIFVLFQRLQREDRERTLKRWGAALDSSGSKPDRALQSEMRIHADYWPSEILDLIRPAFEASRNEERIRLLDLMVALGRHLPDRVLPLLVLPEGSSARLWKATQEAVAATLARKVLVEKTRGPSDLFSLATDPLDSQRRATGRRALWLLAWEAPSFRPSVANWARAARRRSPLPLRVELGRLLGLVSEMGPMRSPVTPEARQEPRRARFPPGTSGDSGRAPSGPPG